MGHFPNTYHTFYSNILPTNERRKYICTKQRKYRINGTKRLHSEQRDIIHDAYVAYIHVCVNYTISMLLN